MFLLALEQKRNLILIYFVGQFHNKLGKQSLAVCLNS